MPGYSKLPLGDVVKVLAPTFKSLDLRAIAVHVNSEWQLAAGVIVASLSDISEVVAKHERLRGHADSLGTRDFRIPASSGCCQRCECAASP